MTKREKLSKEIEEIEMKITGLKGQLEFYEQQQKLFKEELIKILTEQNEQLREKLGGVEKIDRN